MTRLTRPPCQLLHLHVPFLSGPIASSLSDLGGQIGRRTDKDGGENTVGRESKDEQLPDVFFAKLLAISLACKGDVLGGFMIDE